MDMDSFLTEVYVIVDDWYKSVYGTAGIRRRGVTPQLSDSEVLTLLLVEQWQVGVTWRTERGMLRWMAAHGRCWFPVLVGRSAFNRRARNLWGVVVQLGQALGERLSQVT